MDVVVGRYIFAKTTTADMPSSSNLTSIVISQVANVDRITIEGDASSHSKQEAEKMPPKPYDDLFIEPPDDYDVVYGDYNTT
uniref:Reverse transcriptase domain-containing protein n=1 Tax=Ascaris lumbricoides TaxID=6252 RepID=A0A0M3HMG5_ASCLU